jgi:hypothetical protein
MHVVEAALAQDVSYHGFLATPTNVVGWIVHEHND